mgnify:CR=1 FL=1
MISEELAQKIIRLYHGKKDPEERFTDFAGRYLFNTDFP